ncbi:MAG: hypothetical protein ABJA32_00840 [Ginsengibacter sp.]
MKYQSPIKNSSLKLIGFQCIASLLLFCALFAATNSHAQGNLLITPKRIVFDGTKRSAEINLANIGNDTATYLISWVQYKMNEFGKFEKLPEDDSSQNFADKNVRVFPRKVTLGPNEAQSVKLQVIRRNELKTGEYRSHLFFRALDQKPLGEEDTLKKETGIVIKMTPVFGISIPVIIQNGETSMNVTLSDAALEIEKDTIPNLKITFNRTGNISSYGDLSADFISSDGTITQVGLIRGVAVYTPNDKRIFTLKLDRKPGIDFKSGKLRIVYSDQSPKKIQLAEEEISL